MASVSEEKLMELKIKLENGIKLSKDEKKILKENDKEALEKKKNMSFRERMLASVKSETAQLMGENDPDKFPIRDWISTGNYLLNAQISADPFKGMPSGRVWQLAGINSCGKTFLMLETIKNAQKLGYFVVLFDTEMANNDRKELKKRGIDVENMLYIPISTVEKLKTDVLNILAELGPDDKVFIGVDSIGNISTKKELEDSLEGADTKDMTRATQLKAFFRVSTIEAGMKNVPMVVINHVYDTIGGFGGKTIGGGGGSLYNSSIINEFTKAQEKSSDGKTTVGACITSTTTKCRTAKEKTKVKFSIDFENGLTLYSGLLEFCIDEKLMQKSGQSYIFSKDLSNIPMYTEEKIGPTKINSEFWEEFLAQYLADYLRRKYAYQSVLEQCNIEESEEDEPQLLLEETEE